jgi:signal transduction histidine kinase
MKKQMNNKLVIKIFIGVISIFTIVMIAQVFIQNYLINDIYVNEKVNRMEDGYVDMIEQLERGSDTTVDDFRIDHQAPVILFNREFEILNDYFDYFTSITVTSNDQTYMVTMEAYVDELNNFTHDLEGLSIGDSINGSLMPIDGTELYAPYVIGKYQSSGFGNMLYTLNPSKAVLFDGFVSEISLVQREKGVVGYQPDVLLEEMMNLRFDDASFNYLEHNRYLDYDYIEERSGLHRIVFVSKVNINGQDVYVMSLTTLENVQDAFDILNDYYVFIFGILIVLAIVLSLVFTRWITKPILKLNKVALAIADQNFNMTADVHTKDELEMLSGSLNAISNNMNHAFNELEKSNDELAIEVIKTQENEERMRNMLSGLSHEFKTPLGIASGFIEILKDDVGDKEPGYYLSSIEEELERLDLMVRETIELSRLETGSYILKETSFALNELIVQVYNRLSSRFNGKQQHVIFELSDVIVRADVNKIEQVVMNLLGNANKYADENSRIEVEIIIDETVTLYIRNEHDLLNESELILLWDRFYRTEKSRNKDLGGSGLGLTIVKNILELHGSDYGVRNYDKGLEFYFTLKTKSK